MKIIRERSRQFFPRSEKIYVGAHEYTRGLAGPLERGARNERNGRFLGKHFYAITGIRDWILSKRLQLQEITRTTHLVPPFSCSLKLPEKNRDLWFIP